MILQHNRSAPTLRRIMPVRISKYTYGCNSHMHAHFLLVVPLSSTLRSSTDEMTAVPALAQRLPSGAAQHCYCVTVAIAIAEK